MQAVQTLDDYLKYWGFESHPFLLSPQPSMFYEGGQYFECLERLRYAVRTQKGGVVIVSEDAGLGKTTIILKLVEEMKNTYGEAFKFAFLEHPTLEPGQMIAYIKREITGEEPYDDKLKNLLAIRDVLSDLFDRGGKCIIAVDEAHMLKDFPFVLQELRMLMNLTYRESYLHTFIISGQKPLWNTLSQMKEFWQRLPVKYYLLPLGVDETRSLIQCRIKKAGCKKDEIYTKEAVELIHRSSGGCPRTIIALSDISLLVGYTNFVNKIGEKEVARAIEMLSGKGDGLAYMGEVAKRDRSAIRVKKEHPEKKEPAKEKKRERVQRREFLLILFLLLLPSLIFTGYLVNANRNFKIEAPKSDHVVRERETDGEALSKTGDFRENENKKMEAVIRVTGANVRISPGEDSERIAVLLRGQKLEILDEEKDGEGNRWFKIELLGRYGWISEKVVEIGR